jgi:glycosyltransferase involved in cell wall biosynthesis
VKPLVSILIPAYNAEQFIAQTLESAVGQTWPNKEIIVVDDGSKDQTLAVARRFASKNVYVVTKANEGAAATRNKALSLSQGQYIQWLDADDLLSPDKVALQMEVAENAAGRRTLLSSAWGRFMYRPHRAEFIPTPLWADLPCAEWLVRKMGQNHHMQTATWLVSREMTEAAGPWNTRLLGDDDGEYFCRVLLASGGVKFVPGAKVFYRMSGYSRLSYIGNSDRKMEAQLVSMKLHIGYLRSLEESDRVRAACVRYLQNWLPNFYPRRMDLVNEAQAMASSLGGHLEMPSFPWKYGWIQKLLGWDAARRAQLLLPQMKWSAIRSCDRMLSRLDQRPSTLQTAD